MDQHFLRKKSKKKINTFRVLESLIFYVTVLMNPIFFCCGKLKESEMWTFKPKERFLSYKRSMASFGNFIFTDIPEGFCEFQL